MRPIRGWTKAVYPKSRGPNMLSCEGPPEKDPNSWKQFGPALT